MLVDDATIDDVTEEMLVVKEMIDVEKSWTLTAPLAAVLLVLAVIDADIYVKELEVGASAVEKATSLISPILTKEKACPSWGCVVLLLSRTPSKLVKSK